MLSRVFEQLLIFAMVERALCVDDHGGVTLADVELNDGHLREAHKDLDANGDDRVSHEELLTFFDRHHRDVEFGVRDIDQEFLRLDASGDGKITLEDFLKDSHNHAQHVSDTESQAYQDLRREKQAFFDSADKDGNGMISKEELPALVSALHDQMLDTVVKHSIEDADTNGDLKIDPTEFENSWIYRRFAEKMFGVELESGENTDQHGVGVNAKTSKELFERLDTDRNGLLDVAEMRPLESGKIGHEIMVEKFVNKADKDGDGHIDSDELLSGKKHISDNDLQDYLIAWAKRRRIVV